MNAITLKNWESCWLVICILYKLISLYLAIDWDVPTCLGWVIWWLAWLVNSECDHSSGKLESCNISGIDRGNISEIVLEISIHVTFILQITFMFCSMKILLTLHVLHNISCLILDLRLSLSIQFQFPNQFDQIKLRIRCFPPCSLLYK